MDLLVAQQRKKVTFNNPWSEQGYKWYILSNTAKRACTCYNVAIQRIRRLWKHVYFQKTSGLCLSMKLL